MVEYHFKIKHTKGSNNIRADTLSQKLKELFIAELILKIYILNLPIVVKIDILDFILGIYLV